MTCRFLANRSVFCLWVVLFVSFGSGEASEGAGVLFQKALQTYQSLALAKNQPLPEKKTLQLIEEFEHIQAKFPAHGQAPLCLFQVGKLYRRLFQATQQQSYLLQSLQAFRRLIQTYPQSTLVDDSQFFIGKIFEEDKQEPALALLEYNQVVQYQQDQEPLARQRIKQLQKSSGLFPALSEPAQASSLSAQKYQGGIAISRSRTLAKAKILSIRYWATEHWLKLVINTSRPIPFLYGILLPAKSSADAQVLHIDFLDSQPDTELVANLKEKDRFVDELVLKVLNPRITRLTFATHQRVSWKVLDYESANQNTIIIEVFPQNSQSPSPWLARPTFSKPAEELSLKKRPIRHIVIDPGHGGIDPGGVGFGLHEKDIVLTLGQELKKIIESRSSLKAFLTRNSDRFVSLEERSTLAKQYQGDLFISLHVNAHPVKAAHGIESYYLNVTDSRTTRQLAIRENQMSEEGLENFSNILKDLLHSKDFSQSENLTRTIHRHLLKNVGQQVAQPPRDLGVKEAPFLILLRAGMPATLLEIAFITNPKENLRLQDSQYQKAVAEGIFQGLQDYILQQKQG